MQHKIKPMGHPVHPMLVNYPLGLLTIAPIFDVVHWITRNGYWSTVAFWMIAVGTAVGLLAAVTGTIDWVSIPAGSRAKMVGLVHGAGNYFILALFVISWFTRLNAQANPPIVAYVLTFIGAALFMITGYLGGELTVHFGVGIEPGAHVNASSPFARPAADASKAVSKEPVVS
jgi:uncharacterized membrane protein